MSERQAGIHSALVLAILLVFGTAHSASAQAVRVLSYQKISDTEGDFNGVLNDDDHFGRGVVRIGDLDDDGVIDLAVGGK